MPREVVQKYACIAHTGDGAAVSRRATNGTTHSHADSTDGGAERAFFFFNASERADGERRRTRVAPTTRLAEPLPTPPSRFDLAPPAFAVGMRRRFWQK